MNGNLAETLAWFQFDFPAALKNRNRREP